MKPVVDPELGSLFDGWDMVICRGKICQGNWHHPVRPGSGEQLCRHCTKIVALEAETGRPIGVSYEWRQFIVRLEETGRPHQTEAGFYFVFFDDTKEPVPGNAGLALRDPRELML